MPVFSCWMIRVAFLYLLMGGGLGSFLLIAKGVPEWAFAWKWYLAHLEWMQIGWLFNLVFGVAFWIFPRFTGKKRPWSGLAYVAFFLLNLGVFLYSLQVFYPVHRALFLWARVLEGIAFFVFVSHLIPRVKSFD